MSKFDVSKRFLSLAYNKLYPDTSTMEGLEQALITWYCFQYNVPPNDDKLLELTLEELLVLRQMYRLKDNPELAQELNPSFKSYEEWLKESMGEDYVSEEDMVAEMEKQEQEQKILEQEMMQNLPDKIVTDFTKIGMSEEG